MQVNILLVEAKDTVEGIEGKDIVQQKI